jgi:two-component system sensor histidine kinase/response regulator
MDREISAKEPMKILLVDDQPENLLALEAVLESLGEKLVKARSGREALRCVLQDEFALVLLDVEMADLDGYETAALIHAKPRCRHTPIIFITAAQRADAQHLQGYAVGAVDYIVKPVDPAVLRSKVAVFVELARRAELIRAQAAELSRRERDALQLAETRARLIAELREKNRELDALNRELELFAYSMSNDLRAPLRRIGGFSQALLEDCGKQLDEAGQDHLRRVRGSTELMTQLIDDLLRLSGISRAGLSRTPLDLAELARDVADELRRAEPQRQVEFDIPPELGAEADARLLRQLVENLLGNAWKFTAKTKHAQIELCAEEQDGELVYRVRDNGAGFSMQHADRLFRPFHRLHLQSEFPGSGVGLAAVRRIVERHGGRVWAEGAVGEGATISFTLPPSADPNGTAAITASA